jgi:hypothetical protein
MEAQTLGIDRAENVFQVHGVDRHIDLHKETVASLALLLHSLHKVEKALLRRRIVNDKGGIIVSASADHRNHCWPNKSAFP